MKMWCICIMKCCLSIVKNEMEDKWKIIEKNILSEVIFRIFKDDIIVLKSRLLFLVI